MKTIRLKDLVPKLHTFDASEYITDSFDAMAYLDTAFERDPIDSALCAKMSNHEHTKLEQSALSDSIRALGTCRLAKDRNVQAEDLYIILRKQPKNFYEALGATFKQDVIAPVTPPVLKVIPGGLLYENAEKEKTRLRG